MAETPQDFTRAEGTVLNLSEKFAANATLKPCMVNRSMRGAERSFLSPRSDTCWGRPRVVETAKRLEGVAEAELGARPVGYIEITDAGSQYVDVSAVKKTIVVIALGFVAGYLFRGFRNTR
jgi:hypothetical protein